MYDEPMGDKEKLWDCIRRVQQNKLNLCKLGSGYNNKQTTCELVMSKLVTCASKYERHKALLTFRYGLSHCAGKTLHVAACRKAVKLVKKTISKDGRTHIAAWLAIVYIASTSGVGSNSWGSGQLGV